MAAVHSDVLSGHGSGLLRLRVHSLWQSKAENGCGVSGATRSVIELRRGGNGISPVELTFEGGCLVADGRTDGSRFRSSRRGFNLEKGNSTSLWVLVILAAILVRRSPDSLTRSREDAKGGGSGANRARVGFVARGWPQPRCGWFVRCDQTQGCPRSSASTVAGLGTQRRWRWWGKSAWA